MSASQVSPSVPSAGFNPPADVGSDPVLERSSSLSPQRIDSPIPQQVEIITNNETMDHEPTSPPNEANDSASHSDDETTTNSSNDAQDEMQVDNLPPPQTAPLQTPAVTILIAGSAIPIPEVPPVPALLTPAPPANTTNNIEILERDIPTPPPPGTEQPLAPNISPPPPLADMPPPPPMEEEEDDFDGQTHFLRHFQEDTTEPPPEQLEEMGRQERSGSRNFQLDGLNDEHWFKQVEINIDDPAFVAKGNGKYTWHLDRFHGTKDNPNKDRIMRSPAFEVGGYNWNIKLFPHGCEGTDYVSVYIECCGPCDEAASAEPWDVAAQIGCVMFNPSEPRTHHFDRASHHFESSNSDWGWVRFYGPWQELHMRRFLEYRPMLQNDKISITAYIRVWDDPTKLLFSSSLKNGSWNSFKQTGFRGLTADSPGITAFISGLSLLFHISTFNELIASAPIDDSARKPEVNRTPMLEELKRVLHRWHNSANTSQVESLSGVQRILSWYGYSLDSATDIVQIWRALSHIINLELNSNSANLVQQSPGIMVLARDVHAPAVMGMDVPIESKDCKSVQEIFSSQRSSSLLTEPLFTPNTNIEIASQPDVIAVELNRSKYDTKKRKWSKLIHHIKLDPVINVGATSYSLVAAVVHRGELGSGDFYSVIKPKDSKNWLKYRSGQVAFLTQRQAIDIHEGKGDNKVGTDTIAYVLLYARENDPTIFPSREDFNAAGITQKLEQPIPSLRADESIPVLIHDARNVVQHQGIGFVDPWSSDKTNLITFNIRCSATLADVQDELLDRLKTTNRAERKEQLRLWPIRTTRVAPRFTLELDAERWPDTQLVDFVFSNGGIHLWLEIIPIDRLESEEEHKPDPMETSVGSLMPPQAPAPATTNAEAQDVVMTNTEDEASESGSEDDDEDDGEDDDEDGSSTSVHPDWELVDHCYMILKTWNPQSLQLTCQGSYFVPDRKQNIHEFIRKTLKLPTTQRLKIYQETGQILEREISASNEFGKLESQAVVLVVSLQLPDKIAEQRRKAGEPVTAADWYKMLRDKQDPTYKNEFVVKDYFGGSYIKYATTCTQPRRKSIVVDSKGDAFMGDLDLNWTKNGNGTMVYTNGNKYEGEWKHDQPEGQGMMTYHPSGNKYEGGWMAGRRHGKGIMHYEQSEDQLRTCKICYEEEMNTVLVKCGHIVACHICARELKDCPVCRKPISDIVRMWPTV